MFEEEGELEKRLTGLHSFCHKLSELDITVSLYSRSQIGEVRS